MKKFIVALVAATVLAGPIATAAQAQDWRNDRSRQVERHVDKRVDKRVHVDKKVVIHKQRWSKGHRATAAERRRMADVRDYRRYRLSAPPRGYKWVKVDNDYLMIGIATGVISSIIAAR
ncbi:MULTISPECIES: RcnB family protein [Rhizobiaceae]|jgi:Ni/Co efflux regulator RcnB|uniref:Ni/Co efflux regulator RcnB n=2 Tax=Rhizobiaceae TaxID=82115 RepID=A0A7W6UVS9_9HYPH|nr:MULTISPECIES: RcnB family protein [Rhizobium]MBB4347794.1 Ni/Co efflux regulator RcnB [Rhizobium cellulosilyticum]MBB4409812.1 Ni/Co efflux regulator RcnB [Rhizobium cellulosilyticum]MBB4444499.1 Ni/Co efflux regulator RcnB [Rhizobium cellulosilyticum]MBB6160416.1 Ni/Co efflux regulator RcnB [Rhizobium wenxiniae]GGF81327.1 membrane protein [Rhizobium wenxiniae]